MYLHTVYSVHTTSEAGYRKIWDYGQVICPPAPAPVKEDKFVDKPMPMDAKAGKFDGRRLAGMEGDMKPDMGPKDDLKLKDVPAPPPCYTIQVEKHRLSPSQ